MYCKVPNFCDQLASKLLEKRILLCLWGYDFFYKKDGYRQPNVRQFLHILASPGYTPGTIAVNVTWMEEDSCWSKASQPFTSYSEILVGNCNFFLPLAFNAPRWGCSHWNSGESGATRQWRQFDDRLSRFDTIPACDGQTDGVMDGQTDVQPIYVAITCALRSMTDAR